MTLREKALAALDEAMAAAIVRRFEVLTEASATDDGGYPIALKRFSAGLRRVAEAYAQAQDAIDRAFKEESNG